MGEEKSFTFFPIYEKHFARFKGLSPVVLEIGVNNGSSLIMWKSYLGGNSQINGMDISPHSAQFDNQGLGIRVFIGDATNTEHLDQMLGQIGPPDIVIDDGSHVSTDIRKTFEYLYPKMSKHGIYLVEDLHMAYFEGLPVENSFIDYCKDLMDELNSTYRVAQPRKWFAHQTISMSVYESIVVFERGYPFLSAKFGDSYMCFSKDGMKGTVHKRPDPQGVPNDAQGTSTEDVK
jgi:hypothetical protein